MITGLATLPSFESLFALGRLFLVFFGFVFLAVCWFAIARRSGVRGGWLAFVPWFGMIVAWRVAQAPRWSLVVGMLAALLAPLAAFLAFAIAFALIAATIDGTSVVPFVLLVVLFGLLALVSWFGYIAIASWWAARTAQRLGFSIWVGILASPLTVFVPGVGFLIRLVFIGILAFKEEPL